MRLRRAGSIVLLFWMGLASVVRADDNLIARELADQLRIAKANNDLNDFRIGVKVENGVVWMKGSVQDVAQQQEALKLARTIEGVKLVVNDLTVETAEASASGSIRHGSSPVTPAGRTASDGEHTDGRGPAA